jgi:hypothetical protein
MATACPHPMVYFDYVKMVAARNEELPAAKEIKRDEEIMNPR